MYDRALGSAPTARALATQSASPSAALETRTGERPLPSLREAVAAATPVRDPERYQVIHEHGRGGLGRVLRAHDRQLGRDVAIKELISRGPIGEVRFLREAMITARLEHPGIVPVHEAGRWPDGTPFYAMKLVAGRPLRALIAECTTLAARLALLPHVIAVADAIAYAHGRRIIHRDLKPANVIVGDFGETVVIDWGLAKDLSTADGSFGGRADNAELTTTGSVLGTPAYMAPEQERGEHVDERADVYAIGAMLWELCGPHKVPPTEVRFHLRRLRKEGLEPDLIAIVCKALAPDPAARYPHAGALAADLKAYAAGARIGARHYSVVDVLAHWMRQHRALTIGAAAAVVIAAVSGSLFVRGIARERDRADVKAVEALDHQHDAERAKDDLLLQHAELLLAGDPTAADRLLAGYHGDDPARAEQLRARAAALGVARARLTVHRTPVLFTHGLADGSVLTIGDGAITRTAFDGPLDRGRGRELAGSTSRRLAHDVAPSGVAAFAPRRGLMAYACQSGQVCVLDALRGLPRAPLAFAGTPADLAFSPSGRRLAALAADGTLAVWAIADDAAPAALDHRALGGGLAVRFAGEDRVVAAAPDRVEVIELDGSAARTIAVGDPVALDAHAGAIAIATRHGAVLLETGGALRTAMPCKGVVNRVVFVPERAGLAYACQDGAAGVIDTRTAQPAVATQATGGATLVTTSDDGNLVAFGEHSGGVQVYDYRTGRFQRLLGHARRITALAVLPDGGLASADAAGALALWPPPSTAVRMVFEPADRILAVAQPANGALIATGALGASWALRGTRGQLADHDPQRAQLAHARGRPELALYGSDDAVELWTFGPNAPAGRVIRTGQGTVTAVRYFAHGDGFVTAGSDGRVVAWRASGAHELAAIGEAIRALAILPDDDQIVAAGTSGRLWHIADGRITPIGTRAGAEQLVVSPRGTHLAVLTSAGKLTLYETRHWAPTSIARADDIRAIAFSAGGDELALSTGDAVERIALATLAPVERIALAARTLSYAPDGAWLAVACADGTVWFRSAAAARWTAATVSAGEILTGTFSADATSFIASDAGRVYRVDLSALKLERP